ncbi:MAG: cation transporter [Ruminococcaceae bacterium]|nr:cation transporter [Oscillospiraceae bacterium]
MTDLLCKLFVKNAQDVKNPVVRSAYGTLSSIVGIVLNLLLFVGKFLIGTISGSISIRADAINNLTDAASQIVSLISFRIAAKPADRDHPFGHARIEYVASMIVSMLILIIGYQLMRDSIEKLLHPEAIVFRWVTVVVLAISILVKLWLGLFNRRIGKKIDSEVLRATMTDSLSDAGATLAVLVSTLVFHWSGFDPDAYMGIVVALLILIAGIRILNDTKNSILGGAPEPETVETIVRIIESYPEALGIHDMTVHSYGPGTTMASIHVEVDGAANVFDTHDAIDRMEKQLYTDAGIHATIHLDPIETRDPVVTELRERVRDILKDMDERLHMHDFRMVPGSTHSNLIFDVVVPFEMKIDQAELKRQIDDRVREIDPAFCTVITFDRE